jgi:hypothetical protein
MDTFFAGYARLAVVIKKEPRMVCPCAWRSIPFLLLPFLLSSCSLSLFPGYHPHKGLQGTFPTSWFQADSGHFLFNAQIDLMKSHFSGLMVIKPEPVSYRVVFLSEVGLKLIDLELFQNGQVKVHYMLEAMDRRSLIRILGNDMNLVLLNGYADQSPVILKQKGSSDIICRYTSGGRKHYYFLRDPHGKPYQGKKTACLSNKVRADFFGNPVSGPDSIMINHYNFHLSIRLNRIDQYNHVAE